MPTTITPNQDFKHGVRVFFKGESYQVPDSDANYFIQSGWVDDSFARAFLDFGHALLDLRSTIKGFAQLPEVK